MQAARIERVAVVAGFALVLALQWAAITRQSLTGDGGHHLVAGYQALRYGQNLANLEHPPLVKLIAAAPMLLERDPVQPPITVRQWREALTALHRSPALVRRVTVRARTALLALVVLPLLAACVALGRRFAGPRAGWLLGLSVGLAFCVLPNLAIPETDAACTLAAVLVVLTADRYLERPSWRRALALGGSLALGLVSKFSAVLLAPAVGVALLIAPGRRTAWRRRVGHAALAAAVCLVAIELVYAAANWRYDAAAGREVIRTYCRNQSSSLIVGDRLAWAEGPLLALEHVDPRLAQWSLGLLGLKAQDALGIYPCYAFGTVTSHGRWWYFPVLLAVKLPIAVLVTLLATVGVVLAGHRTALSFPEARRWAPWLTVVGVFLVFSMLSNTNLGVRHMMPVIALGLLPVAAVVSRSRAGAAVLVGALALESVLLTPLWMGATNTWWLGSRNPTRFAFSAGNLEYRQNFLELARETEARGITRLGVLYPVLENEIVAAWVPGGSVVDPTRPLEPGWYAVSVLLEQYLPAIWRASPESLRGYPDYVALADRWEPAWRAVRSGEDHGYVAGSFHLYRLVGHAGPETESPPAGAVP